MTITTTRHAQPLGWTALAWAVAAAVVVASTAMTASLAGRTGEAIEAVTPLTMGVAAGGSALAAVGAGVLAMSRHRDVALLSVTASFLMIIALVFLFSVGILAGLLAALILARLGRRTSGRKGLAVPMLAGPAVAVGVVVMFVIWVQPPLVECTEGGVRGTGRPWWGSSGGGSSSTGETSPSGFSVVTGSIETPSGWYVYRCEGPTLTEFGRA